ncbi:hypothetical protein ACLQ2Q_15610 [Microbacterium sp. DT81.1]|uniref:hypothetical protein n=1 Tax=Microbacterium sp. DT81.1 TaxID=3393413 RepID=UPI003CF47A01
MSAEESHVQLANELRARVMDSGVLSRDVRERAVDLGAGLGEPAAGSVEALAAQIGEASFRVTDDQVAAAYDAVGSEKETFEVVMAASVGAGLRRWDVAMHAIEEASVAAS